MKVQAKEILLRDGRKGIIRSACKEDSEHLLEYLKITSAETPYLAKEPEEITLTLEQEQAFIQKIEDSDKNVMLIAEVDGRHVGNCSVCSYGKMRYAHRCSIGIALYQDFCHLGIGQSLLSEALRLAGEIGYEQAELEVVTSNTPAVKLYEKLGFHIYGTHLRDMKYKDGSYADVYLMTKEL